MTTIYLLMVVSTVLAGQNDTLRIRFIGNAAFELSDGETTLVTDFPYRSGAFGYMSYDMAAVQLPASAVSVITHHHADHFDGNLARAHGWRVIGPPDVTSQVPPDRVLGGRTETRVGRFTISSIRTPHVPAHHSYVISWRGKRIFLTGDTEDPATLLAAQNLDVAFVTPWLLCTITRSGQRVPARMVVLHHQAPGEGPGGCGDPRLLRQGETIAVTAGS